MRTVTIDWEKKVRRSVVWFTKPRDLEFGLALVLAAFTCYFLMTYLRNGSILIITIISTTSFCFSRSQHLIQLIVVPIIILFTSTRIVHCPTSKRISLRSNWQFKKSINSPKMSSDTEKMEKQMVIRELVPGVTTLSVPFSRGGLVKFGGRATIGTFLVKPLSA